MNQVRALRRGRKLTQTSLAEKVGTSQQQIQRIESGQEPKLQLALLICKALDVTLDEVFPDLRAASARLAKRARAANYSVWNDDEALQALEKAGIDTDPTYNLIKVRLACGVERVYHVTGTEKKRLWYRFQGRSAPKGEDFIDFVVFDSDTHRVAMDSDKVAYVHFLFEPGNVQFDRQEPSSGIDFYFSGSRKPHHVGIEPDPPPPEADDGDDEGQIRSMFYMLETGCFSQGEVVILRDEDDEPIFVNPRHLALVEASLDLVMEDDLSGLEDGPGQSG